MKAISYDAWANLVVSGKEDPGERKPCRITIEARNGHMGVSLDRELRFMAQRPGMASIVFFQQPGGEEYILQWPFDQGADAGYTFALTPK